MRYDFVYFLLTGRALLNSLTITPLQYTDHLIAHYQSLSDLSGFVLLESSDRQRGRYDILSALPYDSLKISRDSVDIKDELEKFQSILARRSTSCDLPFQGGAIGYFSYDLADALAGIHSRVHPSNDMPLMDMRFYDWAIVTDHYLKRVHLVAANSQSQTRAIIDEIRSRWHKQAVVYQPFCLQHAFTPLISQQGYQQAFVAIHQELMRGRSYQVNYTQSFLAQYSGDSWEMYKRVRLTNPVPYAAFLRCAEGNILSFSPERFLNMDNGVVQTSPIKGTAKRSTDPVIDEQLQASLLDSAKNRAENVMIVDLLRNDFGQFAKPGSVKVTSLCELQSFNSVHHLVSHIEAQCIDSVTPLQAFMACFPGGSITGAPKREAMRMISEHEAFARGVYCGSIAYFSAHGRVDSNIAIRTIVAKQDTMYLSAGGGIVIDSHWEDEYRECFTKIAAIVNEFKHE